MRSIVYHQTTGKYTLTSDDIQPKGLMRYTLKRDAYRLRYLASFVVFGRRIANMPNLRFE